MSAYRNPFPTVDAIIKRPDNKIVLIERKNEPLGWALPGGFVDWMESFEDAVKREVKEETGLDFTKMCQFHTYSSPDRDLRGHVVSTVFIGIGEGEVKAADDAKNVQEIELVEAFRMTLAFDHRQILMDYFKYIATGRHPSFYQSELWNKRI